MKTIPLCFIFSILLINNSAVSQTNISSKYNAIGVINRNGGTIPHLSLEYSLNESDTVFAIRFIDMTPKSPLFGSTGLKVYNIYFNSKNYPLNSLYNTFLNVFSDNKYKEEKYETLVKLGDKSIILKRDFYSSKPKLHCLVDDVMFVIKSTKELNKLFGR